MRGARVFLAIFLCVTAILGIMPATAVQASATTEQEPLIVVYFYSSKCLACRENEGYIESLGRMTGIVLNKYNTDGDACESMQLAYAEHYGLDPLDALEVPLLYFGEYAIHLSPENHRDTLAKIESYISGRKAFNNFRYENDGCRDQDDVFASLFQELTLVGVLFAGLLDGINPCAISMLLAFFSFILWAGDRKKTVIMASVFILGIFLANLSFGLGFRVAYQYLAGNVWLVLTLYAVSIGVCVLALVLNTIDLVREGRSNAEVTNQLPDTVKFKLSSIMRKAAFSRLAFPASLLTGFLVGAVELACTGQVYLPTLTYMLSNGQNVVQTLVWLVLYNIMFVAPLIAVTAMAGVVKSPERVKERVFCRISIVKIAVNIFYIFMIAMLCREIVLIF